MEIRRHGNKTHGNKTPSLCPRWAWGLVSYKNMNVNILLRASFIHIWKSGDTIVILTMLTGGDDRIAIRINMMSPDFLFPEFPTPSTTRTVPLFVAKRVLRFLTSRIFRIVWGRVPHIRQQASKSEI